MTRTGKPFPWRGRRQTQLPLHRGAFGGAAFHWEGGGTASAVTEELLPLFAVLRLHLTLTTPQSLPSAKPAPLAQGSLSARRSPLWEGGGTASAVTEGLLPLFAVLRLHLTLTTPQSLPSAKPAPLAQGSLSARRSPLWEGGGTASAVTEGLLPLFAVLRLHLALTPPQASPSAKPAPLAQGSLWRRSLPLCGSHGC